MPDPFSYHDRMAAEADPAVATAKGTDDLSPDRKLLAAAFADYRAERDRRGGVQSPKPTADDHGLPPLPDEAYAGDRDLQPGAGPKEAFELVRAGNLPMTEPAFIVGGLLETSTLALVFGDPGCGKSFLAIDLAACVATGKGFHGRGVRSGPVILIAGEGHNGLRRRLEAWQRHHGVVVDQAPLFISQRPAQFLTQASAQAVADAVDRVARDEGPPVMIVVDTLARNFGPGDENSASEMGAFVAAMDALKARYPGCSVLIVHHSGHGDKARGRGSTALKGALDAEFAVTKVGDKVTLTATKMKDAPEPPPISFNLQSVQIGRTLAGEPITSAVLVEVEGAGARPSRKSPSLRRALDTFLATKRRAGLGDDLAGEVSLEDWRAVFYEMSTADTHAARKKDFARKRAALVEEGWLAVTGDFYRLAKVPS